MFRNLFAALLACVALAAPISAATVTSQNPNRLGLSVSSLAMPNGSSWLIAPTIAAGNLAGAHRSPFEGLGAGNFEKIRYWSLEGNRAGSSVAKLLFGSVRTSLSFLWGSPDTYNYVTLINQGTGATLVVSTLDLGAPDPFTPRKGATYVTVSGFAFDKVQFKSVAPAFEFANIAAVPLPAAGLMLLGALAGLGAMRRRRAAI